MMEQRVNIKFCFKIGKTGTETFQLIKQAYTVSTLLSHTWVFEWYLNGLNDLKMGVRIFRMIKPLSILQLLEIQAQSQMSMK
jgi:hypothetical protein